MLRPILVVGGTVAGLAAILSFKTHPAAPVASPAPAAPMPSASHSGAAGKPTAAGTATGRAAGKGAAPRPSAAARTITGAVENTQYGPMQVAVTLAGKKITGVKVLQQTDDGAQSQQIDATAIPELTSETLTAQSAQIDAVSGASYTSDGYKQSLQSALDKA
jgi:uncharacterized protein with FMN-binding domain